LFKLDTRPYKNIPVLNFIVKQFAFASMTKISFIFVLLFLIFPQTKAARDSDNQTLKIQHFAKKQVFVYFHESLVFDSLQQLITSSVCRP
jgi:hypothetical protein